MIRISLSTTTVLKLNHLKLFILDVHYHHLNFNPFNSSKVLMREHHLPGASCIGVFAALDIAGMGMLGGIHGRALKANRPLGFLLLNICKSLLHSWEPGLQGIRCKA
mmetsp:Transcript_5056/g.7482  ORF Transcript_5056/g.7482 Transcript_5056/m.7482 type:complete len:107 (+) Transcript_5056:1644-1964(+)